MRISMCHQSFDILLPANTTNMMHTVRKKPIINNAQTYVWWGPFKSGLIYLKEFSETTTLHGIRHIGLSNRHLIEIVLWILFEIMVIYGSYNLMYGSWIRYNENPTVITVEKDYRQWYLQFPSATFCYVDPVDINLAENYIKRKWKVNSNETFNYYMDFIKTLTETTYKNLENLAAYVNNTELININIIDMILKVHAEPRFRTTIFNNDYENVTFHSVLTEMGICYTFSGNISDYLTPNSKLLRKLYSKSPTCNFLNSLCYARAENLPRIVSYYVHYAKEIPDISDKYYSVYENMERDTTFTFWEVTSAPEVKRLSPSQRRCRFMNEPLDNTIPVYSYNVCRMICRRKLALKLCGCIPHFYPYPGKAKICNIKGLYCLSSHNETLISLENKKYMPKKCDCPMPCEDVRMFLDRDSKRTWAYPVPWDIRFRWAVDKYSKTRLRLDVIYSFEDLLVSLGGTASFFLGSSVLSFIEIGYYFTLRLFWFIKTGTSHTD